MAIKYVIVNNFLGGAVLEKTLPDGKVWWVPEDPENSDYAEYEDDPTGLIPPTVFLPGSQRIP